MDWSRKSYKESLHNFSPPFSHAPSHHQAYTAAAAISPEQRALSHLSSNHNQLSFTSLRQGSPPSQAQPHSLSSSSRTPEATPILTAQISPPTIGDDAQDTIYVNSKQYQRIIARRKQRGKLGIITRKRYLYESRHLHTKNRPRHKNGRFLTVAEIARRGSDTLGSSRKRKAVFDGEGVEPNVSVAGADGVDSLRLLKGSSRRDPYGGG